MTNCSFMKNSFLWEQCRLAYKTMQLELKGSAGKTTDEVKWIEWAFGIAMQTWFNIEELVTSYRFADQKEENSFYKTLQPQFLGVIDYFTLLYRSVLFQPDEGTERYEYWKDEYQNCREFIARCKAGCRYQEQCDCITDQQPIIFGVNINHNNIRSTSYSYLASRMIALKKYMQYIKEKRI